MGRTKEREVAFQSRRTKLRNHEGKVIKESELANEAAKYLQEMQWAPRT